MLLSKPKDWFVVKNDEILSDEKCFTNSFSNKNAFVELSKDEFNEMKKFLEEYETLSKNDFNKIDDKKEE